MHEYAITKSIVRLVIEEAEKVNASRVSQIHLVIGDLSSIIDDSVRMYFNLIAEDTVAEGAELVFERIKAEFYCKSCGKRYEKPIQGFACPQCGSLGSPTDVGKEFYIKSIEVEAG